VLRREPANTNAMSNLIPVLAALGRGGEAQALGQKLAAIEPDPPFAYFKQGVEAMRAADYEKARMLFAKEIDRAAYYHEFHYWLAMAEAMLGHGDEARRQLAIALDTSTTRADRDLYAAKLARIRAHR
jgi:tetratricopeptide (TPR) repeat protein